MIRRIVVASAVAMSLLAAPPARGAPGPGSMAWPVEGPVIRAFVAPASPYSSGHRGIDIAASEGTPVLAASGGTVSFAGKVAGSLFVTIDHGGDLFTTYSWLSEVDVRKGDVVDRGVVVARSGPGHSGVTPPHLHFGVKLAGTYVDPLTYLEAVGVVDLVRLAPMASPGAA